MKNVYAKRQTQNKKSYSRFLFFGFESRRDQESRWCNRRNFEKKVDQTLHNINTYHSPHVNHAWKWPQKILCGPPWPSFFIVFRNLSSDLTRRDRKKNMNQGTHGSQRSRIRHYQGKLDVQKCAQNFRNRLFVWVMARHSKPVVWQILLLIL